MALSLARCDPRENARVVSVAVIVAVGVNGDGRREGWAWRSADLLDRLPAPEGEECTEPWTARRGPRIFGKLVAIFFDRFSRTGQSEARFGYESQRVVWSRNAARLE